MKNISLLILVAFSWSGFLYSSPGLGSAASPWIFSDKIHKSSGKRVVSAEALLKDEDAPLSLINFRIECSDNSNLKAAATSIPEYSIKFLSCRRVTRRT